MPMPDAKDAQIKSELCAEIETIQNLYRTLCSYLSGTEIEALEVVGTFQVFKDSLNRISAHIMTFYTLEGQKTMITWEPLLVNIGNALETLRKSVHPQPRTAIQCALTMSEPNAQEVMAYFAKLKVSLH
jgi:hypothetical protein